MRAAEVMRDKLHFMYGQKPGLTCKTCKHLKRQFHHDKVYYKCAKAYQSRSASTDWRVNWTACGLHWADGEEEVKSPLGPGTIVYARRDPVKDREMLKKWIESTR